VKDNFIELGVIWTIAGDWGKPPTWSHSPRLSQSVMKGRNRGNSGWSREVKFPNTEVYGPQDFAALVTVWHFPEDWMACKWGCPFSGN